MVNWLFWVKLIYGIILFAFPIFLYWFLVPVQYLVIIYWVSFGPIAFVSVMIICEIIAAVSPCCGKVNISSKLKMTTDIAIIIPAYFPNEYKILSDILNNYKVILESSNKINLFVLLVHNGKLDVIEDQNTIINELSNIHENIYIIENENSKSKAENINFGMDYLNGLEMPIDIVSIFDADHKPNFHLFELVASFFESNDDIDIIQGRCAVSIDSSFLSKMIAIEFSEMYSLYHNGGSKLRTFGLFGGSNGHWKFNVLNQVRFDHTMMTEDIDATMRSLAQGFKIAYYNEIISYELAPPNLKALYSQRLRWAQGWAEVTWKDTGLLLKSKHLTFWQKMCCFFILPFREIYYYVTMHIAYVGIIYLIKMGFNFWPTYVITAITSFLLFVMVAKSVFVYFTSKHCTIPNAGYFILYMLISLPYEIFKIYIVYFAHLQFIFKERTWRTTPRD